MSQKGLVLVTGASGYVAGELISQLLSKEYRVRGTVRSLTDKTKVQHLLDLSKNSSGSLELVEADLLKQHSFDNAVKGVEYVFHTASPFVHTVADPQKDLIEPAVEGTKNVLSSVVKEGKGIKRVILTSSVAAVRGLGQTPLKGSLFTEEDWNTVSTITNGAYPLSKTLAEKEAWKIANESGIDLVTINPSFVMGPPLSSRTDATSIAYLKSLLEGKATQSKFPIVDIRDVCAAHVAAMENPHAKGRYIVSQRTTTNPGDVAELLQKNFSNLKIDVEGNKKNDEKIIEIIDNSKVQKELGIKIRPKEESFVDMAKKLIELGVVKTN